MENSASRRMSVRLTKGELLKFFRYDTFFTMRIMWNLTIALIALVIYIAAVRTFMQYRTAVIVIGGIFFAGLLYNLFVMSPAAMAEQTVRTDDGIISELEFFGTYFTEKHGNTIVNIPYGGMTKAVEKPTAFYIYYDPRAAKVAKISEDGHVAHIKNRAGMAVVVPKDGLTEKDIEFIRSIIPIKKQNDLHTERK